MSESESSGSAAAPAAAVAPHRELADAVRALAADLAGAAGAGHLGLAAGGMADVATVLFTRRLVFDPASPLWPDRDRFVVSAGRGAALLYALLHLAGYPDMTVDELGRFRRLGARTAGHPEHGRAFGIEATTGPPGQGLANAVGMAIAERHMAARFGEALVDHRTYVLAGEGCLTEGIGHEACSLAGELRLSKLVVLHEDRAGISTAPLPLLRRFDAYGWSAAHIDGREPDAVDRALAAVRESDRPSLIVCRSAGGEGAPAGAGSGRPRAPFEVPGPILARWREAGSRGAAASAAWRGRLEGADEATRAAFEAALAGDLPADLAAEIAALKERFGVGGARWPTREASRAVSGALARTMPALVGVSAGPAGSDGADAAHVLRFGEREHAMVAAVSGMALHGGVIPHGATRLAFADYGRPAIRLAAMMRQRVVLVAADDGIGSGEEGPTHQPVEQLAGLRAIPNLLVFRPADAVEAAECWELALGQRGTPSVLALGRQELPLVRAGRAGPENLCARGAYVLAEAAGGGEKRRGTILATGSEVHVAIKARDLLAAEGVPAAVVSMPSWELFERQDAAYRAAVLGTAPRVAVEAAVAFGWARYVPGEEQVVGLLGYGASGPYMELYERFGITPAAVARRLKDLLAQS